MPLLDLKTDLRSLKFGGPREGDMPDGAWSGQPYITPAVLGPDLLLPRPDRFALGTGTDFLLRGGASAFVDATTDTVRLGKMFIDTQNPAGIQFIAKQNLLSATGVSIFAGYTKTDLILSQNNLIPRLNDGTYLPTSTLLAAGPLGNIIGAHPNKQGTDPTGTITSLSRPQYITIANRSNPAVKEVSRLKNLTEKFVQDNSSSQFILSYGGGPDAGSNPSAIRTRIKFGKDAAQSRTGRANPLYTTNQPFFFGRGGATMDGELLSISSKETFRTTNKIQDFRKVIKDKGNLTTAQIIEAKKRGTLTAAIAYNGTNTFENRVNAGNPGDVSLDRRNYSKGATNANGKPNVVNKINALYMYKYDNVTNDTVKNDFVKLRFAIIDPDNPSKATFVHFPSFFDGNITDNMTGNWGSFKYLGRGEEFYNYEGFSRNVSFNIKVVAQSKAELSIMYQKLNYLQSSIAPNFSTNGFMRGNIHRLTLGGYFWEQPGVITSLNYTMPSDSTWEIAIPTGDNTSTTVGGIDYRDPSVKELTHIIDVSISFKPIHDFLPQTIGSPFDTNNLDGIFGKEAISQRFLALTNDGDKGRKNDLYAKGVPYASTNIVAPPEDTN
jgi:hypothetical protein